MFPALALLTALAIDYYAELSLSKVQRLGLFINYFLWLLIATTLAVAIFVLTYYLADAPSLLPWLLMGLLIIMGFVSFYLINQERPKQASYSIIMTCLLVFPLLFHFEPQELNNLWLTEKIYNAVKQKLALPITAENPLYTTEYQEPSLVFKLGTKQVIFLNPDEAIKTIQEKHQGFALIPQREYGKWQQAMKSANLSLHKLTTINGYRYSKGKWLRLNLIAVRI